MDFADHLITVCGRQIFITGTYIPGVPAHRQGHPDTWTPAEEPELDIQHWTYADTDLDAEPVSDAEVDAAAFHALRDYCRDNAWREGD